jgi:DNA-binding response OmpR family regulator
MSDQKILVVDDDAKLRDLLTRYLSREGFVVSGVADGRAMDRWLADKTTDLIVLDLMLPGEDGLSIARRLRGEGEIPIIMLTARGEEIDRIIGLEMGADDYLPKPFNPRELLARIRAVLRRKKAAEDDAADQAGGDGYSFGPFHLDLKTHILTRDGSNIPLTGGEFALLRVLITHPNRVLTRDRLVGTLKGYDRSPFDRSIDVKVTRLRKKLEQDPTDPQYIRTVWGEGYIFTPKGNPSYQ